jgi:predicted component of type VI protein secretion system
VLFPGLSWKGQDAADERKAKKKDPEYGQLVGLEQKWEDLRRVLRIFIEAFEPQVTYRVPVEYTAPMANPEDNCENRQGFETQSALELLSNV